MLTDRLSRFRFGSLRSLSPSRFTKSSSSNDAPEIQSAPLVPAFQMDYTVNGSDTLERIAALHDCTVGELMKLNRMSSRMVFPGQKIVVPVTVSDDVFEQAGTANKNPIIGSQSAADGIRKGPGGAMPVKRRGSLTKTASAPVGSTDDADSDCLQRFLKIKVKQVTESDGTVSGTLLVTPNCLMFDPDVTHPLVKENGQDLYGMVANMDEIMAVSVYKEISALTGDQAEKKKDIFDPDHIRTAQPMECAQDSSSQQPDRVSVDALEDRPPAEPVTFTCEPSDSEGYDSAAEEQPNGGDRSPKLGSESYLPAITEETKGLDSPDDFDRRRAASDITCGDGVIARDRSLSSRSEDRPRSFSELDAPSQGGQAGIGRFSPNAARRSFGKLGRTLSARAKSVHSSVAQGAEKAVQGTKNVAQGVVTHTKNAADTLQTGLETSVKAVGDAANAAASQAKMAADAVAAVPGRVVDMGTSFVSDGINGMQDMFVIEEQRSASQMKREQSLATLEGLKQKTQQARDDAAKHKNSIFSCATSTEEMPDLFLPMDEMISRNRNESETESPQLPYYMAVRLTRKKRKITRRSSPSGSTSVSSYDEDCAFGNRLKREFWYAIPRSKADNIYSFLLQWSPEKYGRDTTTTSVDDSIDIPLNESQLDDRGFIVLDSQADEILSDLPVSLYFVPIPSTRNTASITMGVGPSAAAMPRRERAFTTRSHQKHNQMHRLSCPSNYMTQFDVKQMMQDLHDVNKNSDHVPNMNTPAGDPLEDIHQLFYCDTAPGTSVSSDGNTKKQSLRSTRSNASSDSGVSSEGGGGQRVSLEDLHWGQCIPIEADQRYHPSSSEEATPVAATPMTPTIAAHLASFEQSNQKKRFLHKKRFFTKKKTPSVALEEQRSRSKSLGANTPLVTNGEKPAPLFGSSLLNREWELVTVSEMCRRLSLDELEQLELPIPEGASSSQILDELMIRQIMEVLPARAEGYPWVNIYNSEKHGFSLSTLYRKMVEFDEDLSPVLLIIRDTNGNVFGAVVSGAIRPSDHYTGTGDSCLLWRFTGVAPHTRELHHFNWTGDNQFFVNAAKDSLSIGAGGGHFGLWLDADLNHGRSQRCDTFDNEPLSGEKEDFTMQFVEAYGFRM